MAFRKEVFEKYGFFQINVGKKGDQTGGDDTEFCLRLRNAGEKMFFVPNILIYHPVEEKRLTKKYFLKWFFYSGRALAKIEKVQNGAACIFFIPAYMYKKILKKLCRVVFNILGHKKTVFEEITGLTFNSGQACEFFIKNKPKLKWKIFAKVYSI